MRTSSKLSKKIFSTETEQQLKTVISRAVKFNKSIEELLIAYSKPIPVEDTNIVLENIFAKFHLVAKQLCTRYDNRDTLKVGDEYDVQDLFHGLLQLHFDDIRKELVVPEHAGASSRIDFYLPKEQIAVEVKKTRKELKKKELGDQLIIDIERYQKEENCKMLYCFVYDPDEIVTNPRGFEKDLSKKYGNLLVKVFIVPRRT